MGASARASVEVLDADDAQRALPLRGLAQIACRSGILELHRQWAVLENDLIGAALGFEHGARLNRSAIEVDGRTVRAEVEAHRV